MKKTFLILILFVFFSNGFSQSKAGITNVRDTSYNVNSEYRKLIKSHPFIEDAAMARMSTVAEKRNISYSKPGKRNLLLDMFYRAHLAGNKKTAIIIIHGGGWRSGDKSLHHPLAQQLALMGYVCITPEYRLSTEALYPAAVHDIKTVIRWVRKNATQYNIDTNRIVVAGHSAGGELAAFMGATNGMIEFEGKGEYSRHSSRVNAIIDMDGTLAFIHPESGEGDDSKKTSAATYWFGYSKEENPGLWKQAAPLTHVGKHSPPILFINSSVARMHAGRDDYIKILDKYNIYSEVKTFENAPHSFPFFEPWFTPTVRAIDDFLKKIFSDQSISKVWTADNGDGTYKNPIIHADYSDPDAIRVGDDYYMIASSFNAAPGLPILHSKDLVNWKIIGHGIQKQIPYDHFSQVRHGNGIWAPSIRYHNNEFCIYYPDPDFGIYLIKSKNILGPWSEPALVEAGKGLIDPCPLWDDDGKIYLVHAYAGSRAGIKSVIVVKELSNDGTKVTGDPVMVYDGHGIDPTIEGPKFYKRNGYYYIFAPAGGVSTGWQTVLRSKNIYGPYERKIVLAQGTTSVNGPHQGAWVTTQTGEDWFLHFQDKEAYGRIVHLQPMKWINDWPVMGIDKDGDGTGEPVMSYKKPNVGKIYPIVTPQESDEFNQTKLGLQWQWQANPGSSWALLTGKSLRLYSVQNDFAPGGTKNLWNVPNILMQKFPAEEFTITTKIDFKPNLNDEKVGLVIMGTDYAYLSLTKKENGFYISFSECKEADKGRPETEIINEKISASSIYFRVKVSAGAECRFSYSTDGKNFSEINKIFLAKPGRWIGAKLGIFCSRDVKTNDAGYADIDWFRIEK